MNKTLAIIFAGGTGVRMGSSLPKQFIEVNGKPVIIHTLDIFEDSPYIDEIYIACKEEYINKLQKLVSRYGIEKVKAIVPGGTSALGSAYNALVEAAKNSSSDSIVLIHDGVRPCIDDALIKKVVDFAKERGAVVTCTPMFETPVFSESGERVERIPNRANCYTAQAPQAFILSELLDAHEQVRKDNPEYIGLVDSGSLMMRAGRDVSLIKGPRSNIKVTTPEDLYIFKAMMEYRKTKDVLGLEE